MSLRMLRTWVLFLVLLLCVTTLGAQGITPPAPNLTMTVGETQAVQVPMDEEGLAVGLVVDAPQQINIIVRAAERDGTNPQFVLLNSLGREIIRIDDNPAAEASNHPDDAVIENMFLIPATYTLLIQRSNFSPSSGSGNMLVTVERTQAGFLNQGQVDVLEGWLQPGQVMQVALEMQQNTYASFAAHSMDGAADLQLIVRHSSGEIVFADDDHLTNDLLLDIFDPRIENVVLPADDTYSIEVLGYSADEAGPFVLIIDRIGTLDPTTAGVEVLTGESLLRGRNPFTFEALAGEVVTITARAAQGSSFDAEIQLLDPDLVFLAVNDDHGTEAPDLQAIDARISRIILPKSGVYTLDVNSVAGRGAFEVVIERHGRLLPGGAFAPIEASLRPVSP